MLADLMEKGKTTGMSGRLLCNPAMRKALEDAEKEELEKEQREKEQKLAGDNKGAGVTAYLFVKLGQKIASGRQSNCILHIKSLDIHEM